MEYETDPVIPKVGDPGADPYWSQPSGGLVLLLFVDLDPDLAALGPLGGFFALRTTGTPSPAPPTLAHVYGNTSAHTGENAALHVRVRKVADALRAPQTRIAVSVAQQGLAARLWSVALGCAVLYEQVPDLDPRLLRWDPAGSAPDDLWLSAVRPLPANARTLTDVVLRAHLQPLTDTLHARYRVAEGLLWGNAASALAGAARQLDGWARARGRPRAGGRARALAAELLAHPLLVGTGTFTGTLTGTAFRRRSCCLYYRVPGGGVCGDCCFPRDPRSSPHATSG